MDNEKKMNFDNILSSLNSMNDEFVQDYFNDENNDIIDIQEVVDEFSKEKRDKLENDYVEKKDVIKKTSLGKIPRMSSEDILYLIDSTSNSKEFFEEIENRFYD